MTDCLTSSGLDRRISAPGGRLSRSAGCVALLTCLVVLPGCGGLDGIEFQGKIFDAVGLTGSLGKKEEPKTTARAPLVLPPSGQTLSAPGTVAAAPVEAPPLDPAWPQDPDQTKSAKAKAQAEAQKKYCSDGNWQAKAHKDEMAADAGPHGRCSGSIFSVLSKGLLGE